MKAHWGSFPCILHASFPIHREQQVKASWIAMYVHSVLFKKTQKSFSHLSIGLVQFLLKCQQDFADTDKTILKCTGKGKGIRIAKTILKTKN